MSRLVEVRKAYAPTSALEGSLRVRRQLMQNPIGRQSTSMFKDGMRSRGRSYSTHGVPAEGEFKFGGQVGRRVDQLKAKGVSKARVPLSGKNLEAKTKAKAWVKGTDDRTPMGSTIKGRVHAKLEGRFGKADRDQNSSISVSTKLIMPASSHKASVTSAHSRTGSFAGKSRGVGRHETRDQYSSPAVVRLTPRTPQGRFAGRDHDVQVFHPKGGVKQPGDNRIQHYRGATVGRRMK